ncbi:Lipid transfer protein [Quillaja saponaria]|uniref:Lipid transfer protein n=1 Tax=Quillaja saponaria TaxID=32244 RepID=A0AAD7PB75_QUISA|nr:Lipid transfer protein [Quillaja saponaria]
MASSSHTTTTSLLAYLLVLTSMLISSTIADSSKDKEECAEQLTGLATCLPYVGGQAKTPTPDCCSGLKQVLKNNKKCLCVIIADRNDPDLGLQINVTLALSLPTVCDAPANVSKCPELLKLDPKSKEAQVFYQLDKSSNNGGNESPAPSPTSEKNKGSGILGTSAPAKSDAYCNGYRLLETEVLIGGLLIWFFMRPHSFP